MANKNLNAAKAAKNDEFYTTYGTVEEELQNYTRHFEGAVVFCNCDDPTMSNFWRYFHTNFKTLKLKKLISTHYEKDGGPSYKMEYEGGDDLDTEVGIKTPLKENGDFRSEECLEILRECSICCTNPPFSLFREYMKTLVDNDTKFVIIGTMNSLHYKEIFPLIRDNKVWTGFSFNKTMEFIMPDDYELKGKAFIDDDGKKHGFVPGILWYTNLDIEKRHEKFFKPEEVHAYYEGNEDSYPKYYNYDAIEVGSVDLIPIDYQGEMGVPDSFLERYNPDEFLVVGLGRDGEGITVNRDIFYSKIKKMNPNGRPSHIGFFTSDGKAKEPYSRIIIKNRHPVPRSVDEAM